MKFSLEPWFKKPAVVAFTAAKATKSSVLSKVASHFTKANIANVGGKTASVLGKFALPNAIQSYFLHNDIANQGKAIGEVAKKLDKINGLVGSNQQLKQAFYATGVGAFLLSGVRNIMSPKANPVRSSSSFGNSTNIITGLGALLAGLYLGKSSSTTVQKEEKRKSVSV